MTLEKTLQNFLNRHYKGEKLLLALSGGPDSLALFYILKKLSIPFAIAHVDHGWRQESAREAEILRELAKDIPFHLKTLKNANSELECRQKRLEFFSELDYQAVILGHQKDDQIETVAKRLFEGSSNLSGMHETSVYNGMSLWRPLLSIEKKEILSWLQKENITPFYDSTNDDTKYLRNRMRHEILPYLSEQFGKEISNSIYHLGEDAKELHEFMRDRLPTGDSFLDLSNQDLSPFELKYLLRQFCSLSRSSLNTAVQLIQTGAANKTLENVHIDRKRVFLLNKRSSEWQMTMKEANTTPWSTGWKEAWQGEITAVLPKGDYQMGFASPSDPYPRTSPISKWWNNHKIPIFLAQSTPVFYQNGKIVHEFLTGKVTHPSNHDVQIEYKIRCL